MSRTTPTRWRSQAVNSKSAESYLDHNAGTQVRPESLAAFVEANKTLGANPAALHRPGRRAQGVLEQARDQVGELLGRSAKQIVFTSSATEANNIAILGAARAWHRLSGKQPGLISSACEHPSVLGPMRSLQQEGFHLTLLPLDANARIDPVVGAASISEASGPLVVAIQWANNETGAIQPLDELLSGRGEECHFHCDAAQGVGKLEYGDNLLTADSLAISGLKFGAPIGVGALILGDRAMVDPSSFGGGHQHGLRPGTESPALAAALATALKLSMDEQRDCARRMREAANCFLNEIESLIPDVVCNHPESECLPNTLSLSFPGIDGRLLLPALDTEGIAASSGSACSSGASLPSSVLRACGLSAELARASLRFSFGRDCSVGAAKKVGARAAATIARIYKLANA